MESTPIAQWPPSALSDTFTRLRFCCQPNSLSILAGSRAAPWGTADQAIANYEAIQTIMEGQFLVTSSFRKVPDVRRGDSIRVNIVSNGLILMALGTSEESGYINHSIRVRTGKTKRELVGKLLPGGVIEVKL
jgi:flagella basal body P-ring formation protein FlgA